MIEQLVNSMIHNGIHEHIRSDSEQNLLPIILVASYMALERKVLTLNQVDLERMAFVKTLTAPSEKTF